MDKLKISAAGTKQELLPRHVDHSRFRQTLTLEELEHLADCPRCQEALADSIAASELLSAPRDLKASVLERSRGLDVQLIAGSNQASRRLQLFYYSLKVGAAVLCSLSLLLFTPTLSEQLGRGYQKLCEVSARQSAKQAYYHEQIDQFTEQLQKLSNFNQEVFHHDKKER